MPDNTTPRGGASGVDFFWLFMRLSGRISRKVYALSAALMIICQAFIVYRIVISGEGSPEGSLWALGLFLLFPLILWASFALSVKRLHDIGKPGGFALLLFIPMLLAIVFVVLCLIPGDRGANAYGPDRDAPPA